MGYFSRIRTLRGIGMTKWEGVTFQSLRNYAFLNTRDVTISYHTLSSLSLKLPCTTYSKNREHVHFAVPPSTNVCGISTEECTIVDILGWKF